MTYELLQETGIGKAIRNYAKESGKIGDKARTVYHKWKNVVAETVSTSTTPQTVKSEKKVHSSKDKTKTHNKAPLTEIDSLSYDNSEKSSSNFVSIKVNDSLLNQKYVVKDAGDESLYTYEKPEGTFEYIDYDPHCNINLGYSPDHPELYPESHNVEECVQKSKHIAYSHKSISHNSSKKHKSDSISETSNGHISKSKKTKTDDVHLITPESKVHKNGMDSKTFKAKKGEKKDKNGEQSAEPVELKRTKHETKEKSKSEKLKNSVDSKQKTSESKHESPNNSTKKLHKKSEKSKSKSKLNLKAKEEFTSSEVSFEDCLGFNDMISVQKKKNSTKSSKKKEKKTEIDVVPKMKRNSSPEVKKDPLVIEKAPVQNSYTVPDIASTLPQIQPNYRPLVHRSPEFSPTKKKVLSNEDAIKFMSSKKEKTAVYSGRRNFTMTEVPTLFNACIEILIDNIDAIECLGGTPYFLVKPVMERCSAKQLLNIENFNPLFLDETQDLWEMHCKKKFKNMKPEENETWRDMYLRADEEEKIKLETLTAKLKGKSSRYAPTVRKAKLAYVDSVAKPPRDVARRQAKHGTALPVNTPMKAAPVSKATPRPTAPAINAAAAAASTSGVVAFKKPKVAPLMAKTLKSFKQCLKLRR